MSKEKTLGLPNTKVLSNEGNFANFPFDIGFTVPFCMDCCPCEAGSVGMLQNSRMCCTIPGLLLKLQKFQSGVLGGKVRQFSYKGRNHSRASLVINT